MIPAQQMSACLNGSFDAIDFEDIELPSIADIRGNDQVSFIYMILEHAL